MLLMRPEEIPALQAAFPESDYYVPPEETLRLEAMRDVRGMFNLIHHASQFKADVYIAATDRLHRWALAHRRRIDLEGSQAWIAPPEHVILRKLEYLHVRDIRFMLAAARVDRVFLAAEVADLGVQAEWKRCDRRGS